jgi:hypothetical protein
VNHNYKKQKDYKQAKESERRKASVKEGKVITTRYVVKNEFGFEEEWEQKLIPTKLSPWVRKQND